MSLRAVVIGASAGGVQALSELLPRLQATFTAPIMVVVHVPPRGDNALVDLFARKCSLAVKEAEDKEPLLPGTIYFAPPNYHLLVEVGETLALSSDDPVNHSRPAIDILFETAADAFGAGLAAVVLTGANDDGARGLKSVCQAGGHAFVQDPATAEVATMPEAALKSCAEAHIMTPGEIGSALQAMLVR